MSAELIELFFFAFCCISCCIMCSGRPASARLPGRDYDREFRATPGCVALFPTEIQGSFRVTDCQCLRVGGSTGGTRPASLSESMTVPSPSGRRPGRPPSDTPAAALTEPEPEPPPLDGAAAGQPRTVTVKVTVTVGPPSRAALPPGRPACRGPQARAQAAPEPGDRRTRRVTAPVKTRAAPPSR